MAVKKTIIKKDKKTAVKKILKKTVKTTGLEAPLYNLKGDLLGQAQLPDTFAVKVSPVLLTQALRVYQAALRQGTQSTKTRGEVNGSTRKIYRQKGTGRARHGDIKAPIFVGGGIVFGPKSRDLRLNLSKNMRKLVLHGLLTDFYKNKQMLLVKNFEESSGKTKEINELLKKLKLTDKKILIVLTSDCKKAVQASANIANLTLRPAHALSPMDLFSTKFVIFAESAINKINQVEKLTKV